MSVAGSPNEEDKKKFRQLNSQLEDKVQSFRRLEEENELLQAEIERARAVPDLPHNLGDQLRDLRNAVEGLKADKRARDREADALQGDHNKLITDNVALVRKLDDAQKENDRLAALKDSLEKKRREADAAEQDELERLRKELAEKEKEAKETFDDIQQKNLKRLKEEKEKWEAKFKAEKERLERDFQAATGAKDATINALENEIHKEKVETNNLLHSAAVVQGQIKELEDEIAKLKRKIADNDHSTDPRAIQAKQDLEKKKKELEDQLGALKANIQNFDKEIDELTKANIAFRNEIQTYKNLLEGVSKKKSRPEPLPPLKLHAKLDEFHSQPSPQKLVPKLRGRIDITKVKKAANGDIEAWFHNTSGQNIPIDSWHIKVNNAFLSCTFLFNPNTVVPPGDAIVQIDPRAKGNLDESRLGPGTLIQLIDGSNTLVSQVEFAIANDSEGDQSCNTM